MMVKKEELDKVTAGKMYDRIEAFPFAIFEREEPNYCYKNREAFLSGNDYVCYIPQDCYEDDTFELEKEFCFTKADFVRIAEGNEATAEKLFEMVEGEHPLICYDMWIALLTGKGGCV